MKKVLWVFACAFVLSVAEASGSEMEATPVDLQGVFLLAENDADLFTSNATVSDASPAVVVPATPISAQSDSGASEAAAILNTKSKEEEAGSSVALIPIVGHTRYVGDWDSHISNSYTLGLVLDFPFSRRFSLEAEADYAKYAIGYAGQYSPFRHHFHVYSFGGNGKVYLLKDSLFRPYIGAGMLGNYYENMSHGPVYPDRYSQLIGSGQVLLGTDIEVAEDLAIGFRTAWVAPLVNRARTAHNGVYAYPYFEEASAMDTSFYRYSLTAKISF